MLRTGDRVGGGGLGRLRELGPRRVLVGGRAERAGRGSPAGGSTCGATARASSCCGLTSRRALIEGLSFWKKVTAS